MLKAFLLNTSCGFIKIRYVKIKYIKKWNQDWIVKKSCKKA